MAGSPYYVSWIQLPEHFAVFSFSWKYWIPKVNGKTIAPVNITDKISKGILVVVFSRCISGNRPLALLIWKVLLTKGKIMEQSTSEPTHENIFCMTWKRDLVIVVESTQFRVHRSILTLQSPVLETMVNQNFKEAKHHRIAPSDESATDILQFLKLLFPKSLIKQPDIPLEGEYLVNIHTLADKY